MLSMLYLVAFHALLNPWAWISIVVLEDVSVSQLIEGPGF